MNQNGSAADDAQTTTELSAVDVQAGQVYETATGVRVEVVEDDARGSKPLVVSKSDRDGDERMSRYSFADMVNYENMTLVEDADEGGADEDVQNVSGEFAENITCPECGAFMSTGYDPAGLPAATCSVRSCHIGTLPDDYLRRRDLWTETDE